MAFGIWVEGSLDFQYTSGGKAAWVATSASCNRTYIYIIFSIYLFMKYKKELKY